MKKIPITQEMILRAEARANDIGLLRNSIRSGHGNFIGCLGEEVAMAGQPTAILTNTYDYDLIINNIKIDVKTKERTVKPKPYYECSVADFNTKQKCHYYVFVSILMENKVPTIGYILGELSKEDFYSKAIKYNKGDLDTRNNFTFKATCYNIEISQLNTEF